VPRVLKLTLEYHGAGFAGWAAQPGLRTVEGVLGDALEQLLGERVQISVAGRTDAGVHARGQVASFSASGRPDADPLEPARLLSSLNGLLPADVAVRGAEQAPDGFDARRDARSRSYVYRVLARRAPSPFERDRALWWPRRLDEDVLVSCAALLPGKHDFTAFTPTRTDHVRFEREVLAARWARDGDLLEFLIEADAFMRHMVRVLVGTMLEAGSGARTVEEFGRLLDGAPRSAAGETVPAHGLHLASVSY
jgi:tRNA pseudouridine38-40 synthase